MFEILVAIHQKKNVAMSHFIKPLGTKNISNIRSDVVSFTIYIMCYFIFLLHNVSKGVSALFKIININNSSLLLE